ncbi:hypothetical protein PsorP6_008297 [Peronosclerospora sorghi]|uniref:Uncharacterized protein n=1 Tax=Peronosclerospora sorghi TaxID=230839 RepID=A0ACC0WAH9_9STRA|nr:hypothetical protein PsorP6_008297 [Peronosclerospora sorghi]
MSSDGQPLAEATTGKRAVDQFDHEFQRYTTKQSGRSARAVAMARAELSKYNALVFQDKKLQEAGVKKGRLTPELRAAYEQKIKNLETALDTFHHSVANYNRTKAMFVLSLKGKEVGLSFVLLVAFALIMFFQPWAKHFESPQDLTYEEYAKLDDIPSGMVENIATSDEL